MPCITLTQLRLAALIEALDQFVANNEDCEPSCEVHAEAEGMLDELNAIRASSAEGG
jgi:hypothetical protein